MSNAFPLFISTRTLKCTQKDDCQLIILKDKPVISNFKNIIKLVIKHHAELMMEINYFNN